MGDDGLWSFLGEGDDNFSMGDDYSIDPGYGTVGDNLDPISENPWLNMVTPPSADGTGGLGVGDPGMDDTFNVGDGGIANMSPDQIAQFARQLGLSPQQASQLLGIGGGSSGGGGSGGSGGGGSLLDQFGRYLANSLGLGGGNGGIPSSLLLPYLAQAYQQYKDSGKYTDLGNQASQIANPFGDRSQYVNLLAQSYKDPNAAIANSPDFQFLQKQGLAALGQTAASNGGMAFGVNGAPTGTYAKDLMDYNQGLASKYLTDYRTQLANLAGAQFNPASAASDIMQGGQLSINAQNSALANAGAALRAAGGNQQFNPNTDPWTQNFLQTPNMQTTGLTQGNGNDMVSPPQATPQENAMLYANPQAGP